MELKYRDICESSQQELATRLRSLLDQYGSQEVTAKLLDAVDHDLIPSTVITVWLGCCKENSCIVKCLSSSSRYVRSDTIGRIGKCLRPSEWKEMWSALGDVKGMIELLARSSVDDVKLWICALRRAVSAEDQPETEKRLVMTELIKCLMSHMFMDAKYQNPDRRQLQAHYVRLLSVCTTPFVLQNLEAVINDTPWSSTIAADTLLPVHHFDALQKIVLTDVGKSNASKNPAQKFEGALVRGSSILGTEDGWTAAMTFKWKLIRAVMAKRDSDGYEDVVPKLILPLLNRLIKRKSPSSDILLLVDYVLQHADDNRSFVIKLTAPSHRWTTTFSDFVLALWLRKPQVYEGALQTLLRLIGDEDPIEDLGIQMIKKVTIPRRYELLQKIWSLALEHKVNLENTTSLEDFAQTIEHWDEELFLTLQRKDGLELFEKLLAACHGDICLETAEYTQDPALGLLVLRLKLMDPSDETMDMVQKQLKELQLLAARSREWEGRLKYAQMAFDLCATSGNIPSYLQCLDWSKRFLRDPQTSMKLFGSSSRALSHETITLLAGTAAHQTQSMGALEESIRKGNEALLSWLRIACDAQREPHFKKTRFEHLTFFIQAIVKKRLHGANEVGKRLGLSEDAVYTAIFAGTHSVILEIEETCMNPEYQLRLFYREGAGSWLEWITDEVHSAAWKFVDELARARDALWMRQRLLLKPEISSLPPLWPRGLPIGILIPVKMTEKVFAGAVVPYLEERAAKIVFASSEDSRKPPPNDKTMRNVIGNCIESYDVALQTYVLTASTPGARMARARKAWMHASTELSGDLDGPELVAVRWKNTFTNALHQIIDVDTLSLPTLPPHNISFSVLLPAEDDDLAEWNPLENRPQPIAPVKKRLSTIDILLANTDAGSFFNNVATGTLRGASGSLHVPPRQPRRLFDLERVHHDTRRSAKDIEATIASAVLWLDLQKGGSKSVLTEGFPKNRPGGSGQRRFPPLLLDPEFKSIQEPSTDEAANFLSGIHRRIPVTLLASLASEAFEVLKVQGSTAASIARIETTLFSAVKLTLGTPAAAHLVADAILQFPDSSSWHRQIMNRRLLKRMEPEQAQHFMQTFADRVIETETKRRSRAAQSETSEKKDGKIPSVKITSVKMIAQILKDTQVFQPTAAIGILSSLLALYTHPDIRVAVVDSLCEIMRSTSTTGIDRASLKLIEDGFVTLRSSVGALDERWARGNPWEDWDVTKDLPDIGTERPLFSLLIAKCTNLTTPKQFRTLIANSVLIPAIEDNIAAHKLWLLRFREKYSPENEAESFPTLTASPSMLCTLITNLPDFVPKSLFTLWQSWVIRGSQVSRDDALHRDIARLPAKATEKRVWEAATAISFDDIDHAQVADVYRVLYKDFNKEPSADHISVADLQASVEEYGKTLLDNSPDQGRTTWDKGFVDFLEPPLPAEEESYGRWLSNVVPIIRSLVKHIDGLRTPAWQANPDRHPSRLPDTLLMRAWLWRCHDFKNVDADPSAFVEDVTNALLDLSKRKVDCSSEICRLARFIDRFDPKLMVSIAKMLGSLRPVVGEYWRLTTLRAHLAAGIYDELDIPLHESVKEFVQKGRSDLAEEWGRSEVEEIRELADDLLETYDYE